MTHQEQTNDLIHGETDSSDPLYKPLLKSETKLPLRSKTAPEFLKEAQQVMEARAQLRDTPNGERSMPSIIATFNALTGKNLTVSEGFEFMLILKLVRGRQGFFHEDDLVDLIGYGALMLEHEHQTRERSS